MKEAIKSIFHKRSKDYHENAQGVLRKKRLIDFLVEDFIEILKSTTCINFQFHNP